MRPEPDCLQLDGITKPTGFQIFEQLWGGEGDVTKQVSAPWTRLPAELDDWCEHGLSVGRALNVVGTQAATFQVIAMIEDE